MPSRRARLHALEDDVVQRLAGGGAVLPHPGVHQDLVRLGSPLGVLQRALGAPLRAAPQPPQAVSHSMMAHAAQASQPMHGKAQDTQIHTRGRKAAQTDAGRRGGGIDAHHDRDSRAWGAHLREHGADTVLGLLGDGRPRIALKVQLPLQDGVLQGMPWINHTCYFLGRRALGVWGHQVAFGGYEPFKIESDASPARHRGFVSCTEFQLPISRWSSRHAPLAATQYLDFRGLKALMQCPILHMS